MASLAAGGYSRSNENGESRAFLLDGSLSYDFDMRTVSGSSSQLVTEVLTYDWSILSWVPASELPFGTLAGGTSIPDQKGDNQPQGRFAFPAWNDNPPSPVFAGGAVWNADGSGMPVATTSSFGYTVVYNNVPLSKEYTFRRVPRISSSTVTICSTEDRRGGNCGGLQSTSTNSSRETVATGYPKWIMNGNGQGILENFMSSDWLNPKLAPEFDVEGSSTRPNIDPTTTSCMNYVTKTIAVAEYVETHYNTTTIVTSSGGDNYDFCTIKIRQTSAFVPTAFLTVFNPQYTASLGQRIRPTWLGEFGGFEVCRGLWTLRLTVKDGCGVQTQSFDDVRVTLRCNRPPVAIACCDTTVAFRSDVSRFPQVTIDGRSSNDLDNSALTYYWSFLEYPEAHQAGCIAQVGAPCEQTYCQGVGVSRNYRTWVYVGPFAPSGNSLMSSTAFGNSTVLYASSIEMLSGVTAYDNKCAPNVYPVIYDFTRAGQLITNGATECIAPGSALPDCTTLAVNTVCPTYCSYQTVENTASHKGNSAYFRPTAAGTYKVQLAVFDGCSTSVDTVSFFAKCQELLATISMDRGLAAATTAVFRPSGTAAKDVVSLNSFVKYEGALGALQYTWRYTAGRTAGNATAGITNNRGANTTFTPVGNGSFAFTLTVEDTCQSKTFGPITLTVACNTPPAVPRWQNAPPSSSISYDAASRSFPVVPLSVTATDADGDDLMYTWSVTRNGVNATGLTVVGNTGTATFRPDLVGPETLYTVIAVANDGCSNSPPLITTISYRCNNALSLVLDTTVGDTRGLAVAAYIPTASAFPQVKVDAMTLSTFPYPQQTNYSWCVVTGPGVVSTLCPTSNNAAAVAATSSNQGSVTFTPTAVGEYTVSLLVNDQCTSASRTVTISALCQTNPVAFMTASATATVWNSFKSKYNGGFDAIDLDGSASAGRGATVPLTYSFSVADTGRGGAFVPIAQDTPTASRIAYTPMQPGIYGVQLTVSNGMCTSAPTPVVTVTAQCMSVAVDYRIFVGTEMRPSPQSAISTWTGTRFEHVLIDGTSLRYGLAEQTGGVSRTGNVNALRYAWTVVSAPRKSIFESSGVQPTQSNPTNGDFNRVTTSTSTNSIGNGTVITTVQYSKTRSTTVTTVASTLFNHHHNLPLGGFLPDVEGAYKVGLSVSDGCLKFDAGIIDIAAVCPQYDHVPPIIVDRNGQPFPNNQVVLSGIEFTRVIIDGRATEPYDDCGTLTYQWTLSKPAKSAAVLNNPNGNIVSVVPDLVGTYSVSYSASDGCQAAKVVAATFTVTCKQPGSAGLVSGTAGATAAPVTPVFDTRISSSVRKDGFVDFNDATAADGPGRVSNAFFSLTAINIKRCDYTSRTWKVTRRECSDVAFIPAPVTPSPVGPASVCKKTNTTQWKVTKFPCGYVSRPNFRPPDGCAAEGCSLTTSAIGMASFKCNSPGTYTLSLTLDDGCSRSEETTTVACRCATTIAAFVPSATTMLRRCSPVGDVAGVTSKKWDELNLGGSFVAYTDRTGAPLDPCPAVPNLVPDVPTPPEAPCCPPLLPCAACAWCPDCPQCPSGYIALGQVSRSQASSTVAGSVAGALIPDVFAVRADAVREAGVPAAADDLWSAIPGAVFGVQAPTSESEARPSFVSDAEEDEVSTSLLLGVVIPISVIIVVSVVGNVLLINKLRSVNELKRQMKRPVSVVLQ